MARAYLIPWEGIRSVCVCEFSRNTNQQSRVPGQHPSCRTTKGAPTSFEHFSVLNGSKSVGLMWPSRNGRQAHDHCHGARGAFSRSNFFTKRTVIKLPIHFVSLRQHVIFSPRDIPDRCNDRTNGGPLYIRSVPRGERVVLLPCTTTSVQPLPVVCHMYLIFDRDVSIHILPGTIIPHGKKTDLAKAYVTHVCMGTEGMPTPRFDRFFGYLYKCCSI